MRIHGRFAIAALAAALVSTAVIGAAGPADAADPGTRIEGITLTAGDRTLVGAQLTPVTVRVHLTDPAGVYPGSGAIYDQYYSCPCVTIDSFDSAGHLWKVSPQAWGERLIRLRLASGTPQDGVWIGSSMLGAINVGFWRATLINAGTLAQPPQPPDEIPDGFDFVSIPAAIGAASTLHVFGSDWPVLSLTIPSTVTPYGRTFVIVGYALTARTHRPVAGLRVIAVANGSEPFWRGGGVATRTSATGRWAISSTDPTPRWGLLWAPDRVGQAVSWLTTQRQHVRAVILSRTASATVVRAGTTITVSGRYAPIGLSVVLQRYYASAWRTVSVMPSAWSSSYRLSATPPRGRWLYRVKVVGNTSLFGTTSPVFALRAV